MATFVLQRKLTEFNPNVLKETEDITQRAELNKDLLRFRHVCLELMNTSGAMYNICTLTLATDEKPQVS